MRFVYHARPATFRGTVLYPLSTLRAQHPELHTAARAKYAGARARNLEIHVPILDVGWDDVIHLLPMHPHAIYAAQCAAGLEPAPLTFFRIPVDRLSAERTAWFRFSTELRPDEHLGQPPDDDFEPFAVDLYRELAEVPAQTIASYKAAIELGTMPMPFRNVPQVLVHGSIDVNGLDTIDWSDPIDR